MKTENISSGTVIALGFFDGVHLGHASLIDRAKELATGDIKSLIYTLDKHPSFLFGNPTPMITSSESRINLLKNFNTDYLYLQQTDKDFLSISPEKFVNDILVKKLGAVHIVSGENYTFGKNNSGNSVLLKKLCADAGLKYTVVPYSMDGENIISSTLIRKLLDEGDISSVNRMLGRKHFISGKVTRCRQVGKTLGFPTANIVPDPLLKLTLSGVYASNTIVDGVSYPSITNVGSAPTFSENNILIETHILDFGEDIYSKEITVEFLKLIRPQQKFDSKEDLIKQLEKDTDIRRKI